MRISTATRVISRVMALTLVFMASASAGTWRCLDGTPCQPECGMGGSHAAVAEVTNRLDSACGRCPGSSVLNPNASSTTGLFAPNGCILSADERSLVSVQEGNGIPLDGPATLAVAPKVSQSARGLIPAVSYIIFFQKHLQRPAFGRAPPLVS